MKRAIALLLAFLCLTVTRVYAQNVERVTIAGGPPAGVFGIFATGISTYLSKNVPNLDVSVAATGGSVAPVALGPFAAAAIAGADPMKTGWSCFRFAKIIYVMPVLMAYTHLLFTGSLAQNLWAVSAAALGTVAFSILSTVFFVTRMSLMEFLLLALATVLAFIPGPATMITGLAIFSAVYFWQRKRAGTLKREAENLVG